MIIQIFKYNIVIYTKSTAISATLDNKTEGCFKLLTDGDELKNRHIFPGRRNKNCTIPLFRSQEHAPIGANLRKKDSL